jgi:hypothetical protein
MASPLHPTSDCVLVRACDGQDDEREAQTTSTLLTEAPVEDILGAKRDAEEAQRLKTNLSRAASRAAADPLWDENLFG